MELGILAKAEVSSHLCCAVTALPVLVSGWVRVKPGKPPEPTRTCVFICSLGLSFSWFSVEAPAGCWLPWPGGRWGCGVLCRTPTAPAGLCFLPTRPPGELQGQRVQEAAGLGSGRCTGRSSPRTHARTPRTLFRPFFYLIC